MLFEKQIEKAYLKAVRSRCDDGGTAYYFSAADFDGLEQEPYPFENLRGERLQGYFYHYGTPKTPYRIVIFEHGMGGGHRSYMKEIEMLARHGYLVFAYDHTGCMESQGAHTNGFSQSLADLHAALLSLEKNPDFSGFFVNFFIIFCEKPEKRRLFCEFLLKSSKISFILPKSFLSVRSKISNVTGNLFKCDI